MNKNTIIGLVLIGAILFGFSMYGQKQQEAVRVEQARLDSIALANAPKVEKSDVVETEALSTVIAGVLSSEINLPEQSYTIENDKMAVTLSNRGGAITSVELKEYKNYSEKPLMLFKADGSQFNMGLDLGAATVNTSAVTFETISNSGDAITFRMHVDSVSHIDYIYSLAADSYMLDFDVDMVGMGNLISSSQKKINITWANVAPQQEKGYKYENQYVTTAYKLLDDNDVEVMTATASKDEDALEVPVEWVAFKQQFFSSIFVAGGDGFSSGDIGFTTYADGTGNTKGFYANVAVDYNHNTSGYDFEYYFGPNSYTEMKSFDKSFQKLIPLGWGIIGWINRFIVIPTFNFLGEHISNYGWIILILTIIIKLLIFPFTYKSYLSMAKMRLLKPDIDKLSEQYPNKEDAMQKQQATMQLYSRAGVSPMGGCLPMLFQMPVLIAMFRFFPASIELRGQSFLWATDLSSYDSILNLPFNIPFYGNHVSLFALLMGISMFISTKINMAQNSAASSQQVPGMTFMTTYFMPVMLVVWFNNYSSALSYYYLLSNLVTIGQTYGIRQFVDDKKLHEQMKAFSTKPKKKNKWQERYEEAMKLQQEQQKLKNGGKR